MRKKPVYITEDGYGVLDENTELYSVTEDWEIRDDLHWLCGGVKRFFNKNNALKYIEKHKPTYSLNDIITMLELINEPSAIKKIKEKYNYEHI